MAPKMAELAPKLEAEGKVTAEPAAFVAPDGEHFEVADAYDLGRATALASEGALKRIWDDLKEDETWKYFTEET